MSKKTNLYEDVVNETVDWLERMSDEIAPEVMGGKHPPFSTHMTPDMWRAYLSRKTPEEARALWDSWPPEQQQKIAAIMNAPRQGGG